MKELSEERAQEIQDQLYNATKQWIDIEKIKEIASPNFLWLSNNSISEVVKGKLSQTNNK